jgi:hypothetical protein
VCAILRPLKNSRNQKMQRVRILVDLLRRWKSKDPEGFAKPGAVDEFLESKARMFLLEKRSTDRLVQTVREVLELWPDEWEKGDSEWLQLLRKMGVN